MEKYLERLNANHADHLFSALCFTLASRMNEISHCSKRVVGNLFFELERRSDPQDKMIEKKLGAEALRPKGKEVNDEK
ncbi:hypothetical protein [Proteiniclasticum sp.]|uniref:hypothetical protein n=1 Tax=Proteiniclasticum sp. TaxID=2053595 RepID=UPI0028A28E01|nr:hypothetical protein [Proteiniclasticum sp.]